MHKLDTPCVPEEPRALQSVNEATSPLPHGPAIHIQITQYDIHTYKYCNGQRGACLLSQVDAAALLDEADDVWN